MNYETENENLSISFLLSTMQNPRQKYERKSRKIINQIRRLSTIDEMAPHRPSSSDSSNPNQNVVVGRTDIDSRTKKRFHPNRKKIRPSRESRIEETNPNREYPILNISIFSYEISPLRETIEENDSASISNRSDSTFYPQLFHCLILISCVLFSSPILLYPQHNSIQLQEYWYEPIISVSLSYILTVSLDSLIVLKYYFRVDSMVSVEVFIKLYSASVIVWILTLCLTYLFWTVVFGYNHPMPLTLVLGCIPYSVQYIVFNFLFYKKVPLSIKNKKKIKSFNISRVWALFYDLQFKGLSFMFTVFPSEFQWILAFAIPLMREFNFRIMYRIMIDSPMVEDGKESVIIGVNSFSALYVAIKLGHTTTQVTSILILAIDFILNIYSCRRITDLYRSTSASDIPSRRRHLKKREYLLSKLILIELIEVLVPLLYVVTVLIAYYGPNAEILGNIRNDYWQYDSIDDIWKVVQAVLVMFAIDGCSAVIVGIILWKVCSVCILKEARKSISYAWPIIVVNIANYLNYHYINLLINCGMDFTMEFDWIKNKTNYLPVCDSSTTQSSLNILTN